jgi:excisionase family DNA binding protein
MSSHSNAQAPAPLWKAEQLAERWSVETQFVYALARRGDIPQVSLGRYRRFRLEDILEFERNGGTTGTRP